MSFVRFQRAGFAPVLRDLELQFDAGWTGVVGPNGAGKTTLLRLVRGDLRPSEGAVVARGRVVLCAQLGDSCPEEAALLGESWDRLAVRLRDELGLDLEHLARWPTLSPGEQKRWQLGGALYAEPDVLLLDEPTNHLDAEGRGFLLRALQRFRGVGVVVSHDRALLDALTSRTLRVAGGTASMYSGAYSTAQPAWEAEAAERRAERDAASEREKALRRRLADARRDQHAAAAQISTGARMKSRYDSDARGILARGKAEMAEARIGRNVGILRRAHEKASAESRELSFGELHVGPIFAGYARCPRPWVLPEVSRDDRVWIRGPNGAGKTTLLRRLLGDTKFCTEFCTYLPQELSAAEARDELAKLKALPKDVRGRTLQVVALLGVDPDALLRTPQPSPGEARKLLLARGLAQHSWLLALDEPTNHLDLPAIEQLEEALADYPGALLLVTHDEPLARKVTNRELTVTRGAA